MSEEIKEFIADRLLTAPDLFRVVMDYNKETTTEKSFILRLTQDDRFTEQILMIANLSVFLCKYPVYSIETAVKSLGFDCILNIAKGVAVMQLFSEPKSAPENNTYCRDVWSHSFEIAIIAATCSTDTLQKHNSSFFLGGLLHDIGKQILFNFKPGFKLWNEEENFGCTHSEVGAWFVEACAGGKKTHNLSEQITSTIQYHHIPESYLKHTSTTLKVIAAHAISKLFNSDFNLDRKLAEEKFFWLSSDHLAYYSEIVKEARFHSGIFFNKTSNNYYQK